MQLAPSISRRNDIDIDVLKNIKKILLTRNVAGGFTKGYEFCTKAMNAYAYKKHLKCICVTDSPGAELFCKLIASVTTM